MLIIEKTGLDVTALRSAIAGDVVVPGDDGSDAARAAWNLAVDQRPAAAGPDSKLPLLSVELRHLGRTRSGPTTRSSRSGSRTGGAIPGAAPRSCSVTSR